MYRIIMILSMITALSATFTQAQELEGTISGVLPLSGSPYQATGDIIVPPESTLIIEPGVTIIFDAATKFHVATNATLLAMGTEIDSIRFTCDTTLAGKWEGIKIDTSTTVSMLSYCIVENSEDGGVYCRHSNPEITHSKIQYCDNQNGIGESFGYGISCVIYSNAIIRNNLIIHNWGSEAPLASSFYSDPIIENNIISDNYTYPGAVGIEAGFFSKPEIKGNTISNNRGHFAYAIYIVGQDGVEVSNNTIRENHFTGDRSGIMYCGQMNGIAFKNNVIVNNTIENAAETGIFQFNNAYKSLLKGNLIIDNSCSESFLIGGTIRSNVMLINNTIYGNICAAISDTNSTTLISGYNDIIWNNSNTKFGEYSFIHNSDVMGIPWMGIDIEPQFRNPAAGDFHLMSIECGDSQNSPCIDMGSPDFSLDSLGCDLGLGNVRADMGAYGGQIPLPCSYVPGDVNGNGAANGIDVSYFINYLKGGPPPPYGCDCPGSQSYYLSADLNGSCDINGMDVTYFVNYLKGSAHPTFCPACPPAR